MTDYHCRIIGALGGARTWSTGLKLSGPLSATAMTTQFAAATSNLFNTATNGLSNYMTSDVTASQVVVYTVNSVQKAVAKNTAGISVVGAAAGDSLPWHEATLVELFGAGNTKLDRGWCYFPPLGEAFSANHVLDPAFIASAKIVFDAFFPAVRSGGMNVYSYPKHDVAGGPPAFTKTFMTRYELTNKPSTQRGRTRKITPAMTPGGAF